MSFKKILVAFDESELAMKSLDQAIDLAEGKPETEIFVVHTVTIPPNHSVTANLFQQIEDSIQEYGKEVLSKAEARLREVPAPAHTILVEGPAIRAILNEAEKHDCDLIIMGSRGLSGVREFLGSVSHYVAQHAHVPVLLVK